MFPMLIPLIGAGAGALLNKKDPFKGAVMGGLLGAGGQYMMGANPLSGLLSNPLSEAATSAPIYEGGALVKPAGAVASNAANNGGLFKTAGNAMQTASAVKGLMPQDQPIPTAPAFSSGGGTPMGSVYQGLQQNLLAQRQAELEKRINRSKLMQRLG